MSLFIVETKICCKVSKSLLPTTYVVTGKNETHQFRVRFPAWNKCFILIDKFTPCTIVE